MSLVSALLAMTFGYAYESLLEIDEVHQERLPDGSLKVVFVTTGVHPTLTQIKTTLWAIFGFPLQLPSEYNVEELQSGPLLKRYRVTVVLRPLLHGREKQPAPGPAPSRYW
jgi:hypothetical protein